MFWTPVRNVFVLYCRNLYWWISFSLLNHMWINEWMIWYESWIWMQYIVWCFIFRFLSFNERIICWQWAVSGLYAFQREGNSTNIRHSKNVMAWLTCIKHAIFITTELRVIWKTQKLCGGPHIYSHRSKHCKWIFIFFSGV